MRGGTIAATAVAAAVTLTAGCATIPSSGTPQSTPTPPPLGGSGVDCCQMFWRPPQPNWGPAEVVNGFLQASADAAHDYALARQYLTEPASRAWRPGPEVTILGGTPQVNPLPGQISSGGGTRTVLVTVQQFGTLRGGGQYRTTAPGSSATRQFTLQRVNGRYLIALLPSENPGQPSRQLPLASDLFPRVYQARNLYFFGSRDGRSLVPDPVFVPAKYGNPAGKLIDDLRRDPGGWLGSAARTALPASAALAKPVQFLPGPSGRTAIVDLQIPGTLGDTQRRAIATQVAATLTSPAYGSALCQAVRLRINGRVWPASQDQLLSVGNLPQSQSIPHWRDNAPVYYLSASGGLRTLSGLTGRGVPLPSDTAGLSQLAVSPDGRYIAGLSASGTTISTGTLPAAGSGQHPPVTLKARLTGTSFTSMSWDSLGNLWVAGQRRHTPGLWMLTRAGYLTRISPASVPGPITALRVAPDGVRVAMAVGTGSSSRLLLGAVVRLAGRFYITGVIPLGPGLTGVTALTWYDDDHLLVAAGGYRKGLWQVPANGDHGRYLSGQSGIEAVTAAGPRNPMYLSLASGQVEESVGIGEFWRPIADGKAVTYPG